MTREHMHVTIIYALVAHTLIVPYLEVQGLTLGAQGYQFKVNITFYVFIGSKGFYLFLMKWKNSMWRR